MTTAEQKQIVFPNPLQICFGDGRIEVNIFHDADVHGIMLTDSGGPHDIGSPVPGGDEPQHQPVPGEVYLAFRNAESLAVVIEALEKVKESFARVPVSAGEWKPALWVGDTCPECHAGVIVGDSTYLYCAECGFDSRPISSLLHRARSLLEKSLRTHQDGYLPKQIRDFLKSTESPAAFKKPYHEVTGLSLDPADWKGETIKTTKPRWFCYDGENFETYDTPEDAKASAEEAMDAFLSDAPDGWDEESTSVCWGQVIQHATVTERRERDPEIDFGVCNGIDTIETHELLDCRPSNAAQPRAAGTGEEQIGTDRPESQASAGPLVEQSAKAMSAQKAPTVEVSNPVQRGVCSSPQPPREDLASPFRVDGPGEYRTRDGRKADVYANDTSYPEWPWRGRAGSEYVTWSNDGFQRDSTSPTANDLVARWTEEASAKELVADYESQLATIAAMRDEAEQAFEKSYVAVLGGSPEIGNDFSYSDAAELIEERVQRDREELSSLRLELARMRDTDAVQDRQALLENVAALSAPLPPGHFVIDCSEAKIPEGWVVVALRWPRPGENFLAAVAPHGMAFVALYPCEVSGPRPILRRREPEEGSGG